MIGNLGAPAHWISEVTSCAVLETSFAWRSKRCTDSALRRHLSKMVVGQSNPRCPHSLAYSAFRNAIRSAFSCAVKPIPKRVS